MKKLRTKFSRVEQTNACWLIMQHVEFEILRAHKLKGNYIYKIKAAMN